MHGHRWAPWSSSFLLLLLACGAGQSTRAGDGAAAPGSDAEQQLARSAALDYKAPRSRGRAMLREAAFGLYAKACAGGDASACWRALEVPPVRDRALLRDVIVGTGRGCAAGDATSCQALASAEVQLKGLAAHDDADFAALCERGIGAACELTAREACRRGETASCQSARACLAGDTFACDEALQTAMQSGAAGAKALSARTLETATRECDRGVAYACWWLVARAGGDAETLRHTAVESCTRGIVDDCATVGAAVTQADPRAQAEAYSVPCRRWGRHCDHVAQLHAPDGPIPDPAALREAHEHACQLGDNDDCLGLAKAYLAHQLPEPVPGRGKDLATYLCSAGESGARDADCAALHATDGSK